MSDTTLSIAKTFSRFPAGRYKEDGPFNGARFRDDFLIPHLRQARTDGAKLIVVLDGVVGYSSSFLEEVFGGLVRARPLPPQQLRDTLVIRADDVAYQPAKIDAESYFNEALKASH